MRWEYKIRFRHNKTKKCPTGLRSVVGQIEEIEDLHDVIEAGPSWHTIVDIKLRLVEKSTLTIEQAAKL